MALGTMNRFLFITIFLWVANFSAMAQAYKVSGHVFLHGQPLSFASVKNAHTGEVALSDSVGCYEIEASANDSLVCEYLGCASKTMPVAGRKRLDFQLEEESFVTDEVVVSANRNEVSRKEAPVVVNVMSAKLFETVNSSDLAKSLNFQSGLRVENNCQNCGFPQVRINGLEGP